MGKLKEALVSMGYRKMEPNKPLWMKPIGFLQLQSRLRIILLQ